MIKKYALKIAKTLLVLAFFVALWFFIALWVNKPLLVPYPLGVLLKLCSLIITSNFWISILLSLLSIILALISANIISLFLSFLTVNIKIISALILPVMKVMRAVPVASFIVLLLLWFNKPFIPYIISLIMVVPVMHENISRGLLNQDKQMIEFSKVYELNSVKRFLYIKMPALEAHFYSSLIVAIGLSFKSAIAAEVLAMPLKSIGYNLYISKTYLDTENLFAYTIVIIILSMILEKIARLFINIRLRKLNL